MGKMNKNIYQSLIEVKKKKASILELNNASKTTRREKADGISEKQKSFIIHPDKYFLMRKNKTS